MMESRLTKETMEALAQPFPAEAIQWKPGATNRDKTRGLALAYVDLRHYIDRLNEVAGADWSDDYEVQEGGKVVLCRLTVAGVARSDVGEAPTSDENTATAALAQAFKRACVKFGLGAFLYRLPRLWVEYDAQKKRFTDAALARLRQTVSGGNAAGADRAAPSKTSALSARRTGGNGQVGPTEFWTTVKELGVDRAAAQDIAHCDGTWAEKVAALSH